LVKRIVLAILLLALMGCARAPRLAPTAERRKEELLRVISRSNERLKSMRGRGRIAVSTGKRTYSGDFSLLYVNPGKLRIDIHGPFGLQLLSVSATGDTVTAFLPIVDLAYQSPASTPGVGGLGDVLTANDLKELVTGTVRIPEELSLEEVQLKSEGRLATLVFERSGHRNAVSINMEKRTIVARNIYDDTGRILLSCDYGRFKSRRRVLRPYVVKIREGETGNRLEVVYEHQNLNVRIRDEEFRLVIPESAKIIKD